MAVLLALAIALSTMLVAVPTAQAPFRGMSLKPSLYTGGSTYVPGETLQITIRADATEIYDVMVVLTATDTILREWNDQTIPTGDVLKIDYLIATNLEDNTYQVEVGGQNYIGNRLPNGANALDRDMFWVQEYVFNLETDRRAYVGGDEVVVSWSANRLRDGSLAANGYGQIWAFNLSGGALISPSPYVFDAPSGTFKFNLRDTASATVDAIVYGWFNDTQTNPRRYQYDQTGFDIDELGVRATIGATVYTPGSVVNLDVRTLATDNPASPSMFDPGEPEVTVDITVEDTTGASPVVVPGYGARGIISDRQGLASHAFILDPNTKDGSTYRITVNVTHKNNIWQRGTPDCFLPTGTPVRPCTISVRIVSALSVSLEFDRGEYEAGETIVARAVASGAAGATLTYIFSARECSSNSLMAMQTAGENTFSYPTPSDFSGAICYSVVVLDGRGNATSTSRSVGVVFGWLVVTSDRLDYRGGETIAITWSLRSTRIDPGAAEYLYEIRDVNGRLVASGESDAGYQFQVPDPPSVRYSVLVRAIEGGRSVTGGLTLVQISGYLLSVTFDRGSYVPGETVVVTYEVRSRSAASPLPRTFRLGVAIGVGPATHIVSKDSPSGQFSFPLPAEMNEGDQVLMFSELNTGAQTAEVLTIRGTNPLGFIKVADIPLFDILLLLLIVLLFIMLWRQGGLGRGAAKPEEPAAPKPDEPVQAPPSSPMTVACRNCNSPIEITTSKRPIEVMCPNCGNTEMVA